MRLVMTILVKNEADIIEDNIRFHAAQGVDAFLVMDNGSDDGTVDILNALSAEFDITVVVNLGIYDQGPWMTELAKKAGKELGADLVISNDADEFWASKNGESLKGTLNSQNCLITVNRYNFVQSVEHMEASKHYSQTPYKVVSPILYSKEDQVSRQTLAMPLVKISPKIIVKPKGLIKIKGGNHRAKHLLPWKSEVNNAVEVHHYPIRSYEQFALNIENRRKLLDADSSTRMGVHYKRWVELLKQDKLQDEFKQMSLAADDIEVLKKVGVLSEVKTPLSLWFEKNRNQQ